MPENLLEPLSQFGIAGLMGALWIWERLLSRKRETQLSEAHRALSVFCNCWTPTWKGPAMTLPRRFEAFFLLCSVCLAAAGCTSPPSVLPMLELTHRVLLEEAERVAEDLQRDAMVFEQTRRSLEAAYDADLRDRTELTEAWVRDATRVYVAAREALVRSELRLAEARRGRRQNLHVAANVQQRAADLLRTQDDLTFNLLGFSLWQWTDLLQPSNKEPRP
jgi:hypothetical protein